MSDGRLSRHGVVAAVATLLTGCCCCPLGDRRAPSATPALGNPSPAPLVLPPPAGVTPTATIGSNLDEECQRAWRRPLPAIRRDVAFHPRLFPAEAPTWLVARTNLPDGIALRGNISRRPSAGPPHYDSNQIPVLRGCLRMGPFPEVSDQSEYEIDLINLGDNFQPSDVLAVLGRDGQFLRGRLIHRGRYERSFWYTGRFRRGMTAPVFDASIRAE